ncbi:MarR family winged helix-turn-helix transcriptional regulator [Paraclostridium bifermentans]|uniref:MarR family winged helix-turn-helix transcriptional regulator n=1 Tax=Paraclostridium bifermentans TaxID=1490 RepID=UPI00290D34FD|nr:MarR family winged helix-turn-helix transcriptional regulator [Paraclostridium bifermentans]MDU3335856.1 MarR family winged helix-turn-helix transcriptional regulator [Paraclostridium bifermentans]
MEKLENDLLRNIGVLSRAINYISDVKYKEFNLQKGQFIFLTRICENHKINFIDLSNMLKVDKTTTTKAVKKLINLGYIYREEDAFDRRSYNLQPTSIGVDIYNNIINEENRQIDVCLNGFNSDEMELALKLIDKMSKNIETDWMKLKGKGDK